MIDSMEKLYDHVNRFHTMGRLDGGAPGKLSIYGLSGKGVMLHLEGRAIPLGSDDLSCLELRTPGPEGSYVSLAEYDSAAAAREIERWEARHVFKERVRAYNLAVESLLQRWTSLHPDDQPDLPTLSTLEVPEWP